jgi:hypothetical protein
MTTAKKLILGSVIMAAGTAIVLSPVAHAIGEQYYLDCLTQHGMVIHDEKQALDIGNAIQHNGVNGIDPGLTLNDLMHRFGQDYKTADSEMVCASQALEGFQGRG